MHTKTPKVGDIVRMGRHGAPMMVLKVWPISQHLVVSNGGERHIATFEESKILAEVAK